MILYRVQNLVGHTGLWYNRDGVFNPVIIRIPNAKSAALPMEYDPTYSSGGEQWYSACDKLADIREWFTAEDLREFSSLGYGFLGIEVRHYRRHNGHAIFAPSAVIETTRLDFGLLA
jgi:hypothetical protein